MNWFDRPDSGATAERLSRGAELFEQLIRLDGAASLGRAVDGALTEEDLRAIVMARVYTFRQRADEPDDYGAWCVR